MDNELISKLETYIPEISKSLNIAGNQVYEKIIWYIRLNGFINLIAILIIILIGIIATIILHKNLKKEKVYEEEMWMILYLIEFMLLIPIGMIIKNGIDLIMQITYPNYYLIDQIIKLSNLGE